MNRAAACCAFRWSGLESSGGQALVETLVAVLALLPLWVGVVYISRWHDLQHATIVAARHAAFAAHQSAGREDPARIAQATRARLFSRAANRFEAPGAEEPADLGVRPQWADHRGETMLLDRDVGPRIEVAAAEQPELVSRTEQQAILMLAPARIVGGPPLDLQRSAARGVTVTVPLQHAMDLPVPLSGLRLTLSERLSLLVDPWAARDPAQVVRRIDSLSPTGGLRELMQPLRPVRWAVSLFEPAFERLCLGRVEPDIVPPDRLSGARGPALDLRARPC